MEDRKRLQLREANKRYQQTDKYKKYSKEKYLDKVKADYRDKTADFIRTFRKKSGKIIKNETEILAMIDECEDSKEVKQVYDSLIHLIKISSK